MQVPKAAKPPWNNFITRETRALCAGFFMLNRELSVSAFAVDDLWCSAPSTNHYPLFTIHYPLQRHKRAAKFAALSCLLPLGLLLHVFGFGCASLGLSCVLGDCNFRHAILVGILHGCRNLGCADAEEFRYQ